MPTDPPLNDPLLHTALARLPVAADIGPALFDLGALLLAHLAAVDRTLDLPSATPAGDPRHG